MSGEEACVLLEWDSAFFGQGIARVVATELTLTEVARVRAWSREQRVDCLYYLADADDTQSTRNAEDAGFRLVDTRVTLSRALGTLEAPGRPPAPVEVGPWSESDRAALRALSGTSFTQSRFYRDPNFPRALCDAFYQRWIDESCSGYAETVLVCRHEGQVRGYVTCHLDPDALGRIGLIAVSAEARGQDFGRSLLDASLRWFAGRGVERASVATQARNLPALRSFERAGFLTSAVQHWFHWWPSAPSWKSSM